METLNELLRARGLSTRCPHCEETFSVRRAHLFDATAALPTHAREHVIAERTRLGEERRRLRTERTELQRRSFTSTATSGVGQTLEMIAASLPGLPTAAQDCRALLKPIDYLSFVGASTGTVEAIQFIEVKSGKQRLSTLQQTIRAAVSRGDVHLRVAEHRLSIA